MKVIHESQNGIELFRLEGNLALSGVREAKSVIKPLVDDSTTSKILINFEKVQLMDSSGIGFLMASFNAMRKRKGKFALCNLNSMIIDILKSTHLDDLLTIFPNEDQGLKKL